MSIQKVKNPFTTFIDRDGKPLENGKIYIGLYGQNPIIYPQNAYWDDAITSAAVQPIRTLNGYPVNNGTAAKIFVADRYSISVYNKNDELIYSSLNTDENLAAGTIIGLVSDLIGYAPTINNTRVIATGYYSDGDEGGGTFFWDETADKSTANAGTIVDPSVSLANQGTGVGLGCWVRQNVGFISPEIFGVVSDTVNQSTPMQKCIDASIIHGLEVVGQGNYICDDIILDIPSGFKFNGRGSGKFTNTSMQAVGSIGTEVGLTSDALSGVTSIPVNGSGLAPGDYIFIKSVINCLSSDAGDMRLGSITGNTSYFAEFCKPQGLQVEQDQIPLLQK